MTSTGTVSSGLVGLAEEYNQIRVFDFVMHLGIDSSFHIYEIYFSVVKN